MRRFSNILASAIALTALGLGGIASGAPGLQFQSAQVVPSSSPSATATLLPIPFPTAATIASPAPAPKGRGLFGRRSTPTPKPTPTPTPTPLPAPAETLVAPSASPGPHSPAPSAEPTRAPVPKPTSPDRAFTLAGGTWNCESLAEGRGTHVYQNRDEFTLGMVNLITVDGRTYRIEETYRFDPSNERWNTTTGKDAYVGTAGPWTSDRWTFDGTETIMGVRHPVKMIYIDLGPAAFRRDFQSQRNGRWSTFSAETCKRASA